MKSEINILNLVGKAFHRSSVYIWTVSSYLRFRFGTFDFLLAFLGRNQVHSA